MAVGKADTLVRVNGNVRNETTSSPPVHVRFREGAGARLPRATRLVVLCRYNVRPIFDRMAAVLKSLGLTLNPDKTRILNAAERGIYLSRIYHTDQKEPQDRQDVSSYHPFKEGRRPHQERDQGRHMQEEPRVAERSNHCETQSGAQRMGKLLLLRELQQDPCTPPELRRRKGSGVSEPETPSQR